MVKVEKSRALSELLVSIDGFLSLSEANLLFSLAKQCSGKGVIVEIGSFKGRSTVSLAAGSKEGNKSIVFAVDPHFDFQKENVLGREALRSLKENIHRAGVSELVVPIVKTSKEAAKRFSQPIELLFIDGAHDYDSVKEDFELWFPKLVDNGIIAFHDATGYIGIVSVFESALSSGRVRRPFFVGSIAAAMKTKQTTGIEKVANLLAALYLKASYLARISLRPLKLKMIAVFRLQSTA